MKRVIIIDPVNRDFREAEVSSLGDMQSIVGGRIELAVILDTSPPHEIYVNEEGFFDSEAKLFHVLGHHQPNAGVGFVIGDGSETGDNVAATMSLEEVRKLVRFL